jgi:hypothetical protein
VLSGVIWAQTGRDAKKLNKALLLINQRGDFDMIPSEIKLGLE